MPLDPLFIFYKSAFAFHNDPRGQIQVSLYVTRARSVVRSPTYRHWLVGNHALREISLAGANHFSLSPRLPRTLRPRLQLASTTMTMEENM